MAGFESTDLFSRLEAPVVLLLLLLPVALGVDVSLTDAVWWDERRGEEREGAF